MATTMNFALSKKLLGNLTDGGSGNGVFAYAFAFEGANLIKGGAVALVENGVAKASPKIALTTASDETFTSGKVYVVIQQTGAGGSSDLLKTIKKVGDINPIDSEHRNYRFDLVEATLSKSASDVADISDIDQFGSTMTLAVSYKNGTDTRGYAISGAKIDAAIAAVSPKDIQDQFFGPPKPSYPGIKPTADKPLDELRDAVMPGNNFSPNPIPGNDWTKYVGAFKAWASKVEIVTTFNGSPLQPQGVLADYNVQYDKATNSFWLIPDTTQGGTSTDYINIPTQDLIDNIYLQTGKLHVHAGSKTGHLTVYDSFTPNNAAGSVAKYFVAGFDAGFWGATGHSVNPKDKSTLDLSETWNWNANYAYNAILDPTVGYSNALGTGAGKAGGQNRFYDPYAAVIFKNSNAYGYSYTDLISGGGGINPAISLWDEATKANVQNVKITLFDLSEKPSSGFKTGNTGYMAPTGTDYQPATTPSHNQLQFTFSFSVGGKLMAPSDQTPIAFRFYAPHDPQAGADGFVALRLAQHDWYYYMLSGTPGHWTLKPGNAAGQAGFFAIQDVPITAKGGPAWYQLSYGDERAHSTYNIYATAKGGVFQTVVADHGVEVTKFAANNFGLNFAPGGAMTYDPATFKPPKGLTALNAGAPNPHTPTEEAPTILPPPPPVPPLVGALTAGAFAQAADPSNLKQGDLAFSVNPAGGNHLAPGHIARIDLTDADNPDWLMVPIVTQANARGDWTTPLGESFGNGTYSALLEQFLDGDLDTEAYTDSQSVTFTVNLDKLGLDASSDGKGLVLAAGGSSTQGNWIEFRIVGSTMPNATLVGYAVDGAGNMLKRDGSGIATSLDDAALARIGSVAADNGSVVLPRRADGLPGGRGDPEVRRRRRQRPGRPGARLQGHRQRRR